MTPRPWDYGVTWHSELVTPPTEWPMSAEHVRERVIKAAHVAIEDYHIENLIRAATQEAEDATQRALMPQIWRMVFDRFPENEIVLERPPFRAMVSFAYVDAAGVTRQLAGSPAEYDLTPSGFTSKARIRPLHLESWPETRCQLGAVTVTYEAGYANAEAVLANIKTGIELMVAELYKQRTLSVHAVHNTPAVLQLARFWKRVH